MIKMLFVGIFVIASCIMQANGARTISCFVNPDFNVTAEEEVLTNVVHIVSEGDDDVIHFVWSTYKLPSVVIARTTKNTTLLINSTKLISFENDAILFQNGKPLESIGVTFSKMMELHYDNSSSKIEDVLSMDDLEMESFSWTNVNESLSCSENFASVTLTANGSEKLFSKDGTFKIQFSVSGNQEMSDEFPHLVFTGNSTLLKFVFENLYSNSSCTRYGFEISLFSVLSDECNKGLWKKIISKSINDEMSPGVFSDVELLAPCSDIKNKKGSFLSWRPVAYTGEKPNVANSSDATLMTDPQPELEFEVQSIAELYFQAKSNGSVFNITFGTPGDGCYTATKYISWSLMVGTGSMVEIPLSTIVIVLASVGLGLLALFLIAGSVFISYRKCKEKDDDLLLN